MTEKKGNREVKVVWEKVSEVSLHNGGLNTLYDTLMFREKLMEGVNESLHGVWKTAVWFAVGRWATQCQVVTAEKSYVVEAAWVSLV